MNITLDTDVSLARYAILCWEPVAGTAERLNVAAIFEFGGVVFGRILIRGEVLTCMYGSAGENMLRMITQATKSIEKVARAHDLETAIKSIPLDALSATPIRQTMALDDSDLMRQVVLLNCSLSVVGDDGGEVIEEATTVKPARDEWIRRVRQQTIIRRPDFDAFFNREAKLVSDGMPVKFDFLSPRLAAQLGLLLTTRQASSVKDARAKLWELELAKARNNELKPALIFGFSRVDDITLSDKQRDQIESNRREISDEASSKQIGFYSVVTEAEAVEVILDLA